jgi:hypothetical protein
MMDTDDCHSHAAECERLAEVANDPKIKHELRALAQAWLQIDVSESSAGIPMVQEHSANSPAEPHRVSSGEG